MDTIWTSGKIENYKRASEYTAFHRKLSVLAEPYLDAHWTLADIGCGPGLADFHLAPMVARIDAIDSDPNVISDLEKQLDGVFNSNRHLAEKIHPRVATVEELALTGESWDASFISFFGISRALMDAVMPLTKRRALVFMHGRPDKTGPLAAIDDGTKFTVSDMEAYLNEKSYPYKKYVMEMQFGQPFRTIADIHKFLSEYGGKIDDEIESVEVGAAGGFDDEAIKRMAGAEERIIKTSRFDYPYYLPKSISVALFIILAQRKTRD